MRPVFPLVCCAVLGLAEPLLASGPDTFDQANRLYEEGRYLEAIDVYRDLATNSPTLAVHFNLGNAYFKSGQIGQAIAEYLEAEGVSPRDPDVRANLKFARSHVDGLSYKPGWLQRQTESLTQREWALLGTAAMWACFGLLTVSAMRPAWRPHFRMATIAFGLLAGLLLAVNLWMNHVRHSTQVAVVVERGTVLRLGPFEESASTQTLGNGVELRVLDRKDDWLQVTSGEHRVGWITAEAARIID